MLPALPASQLSNLPASQHLSEIQNRKPESLHHVFHSEIINLKFQIEEFLSIRNPWPRPGSQVTALNAINVCTLLVALASLLSRARAGRNLQLNQSQIPGPDLLYEDCLY